MMKFPLHFEVYAEAKAGIDSLWLAQASASRSIDCCIPVEFSGPGGGYSPEDFFALSVVNCIIGEFKFLCEKKNLSFGVIKVKARLTVDTDQKKILKFTSIDIAFNLEGASNPEEIKQTLQDAISNCPVCNSIQIPKTLHITIK